jgi:hypothetical protein
MFSANSSPRREAASPVPPRCTTIKKKKLHAQPRSLMRYLGVRTSDPAVESGSCKYRYSVAVPPIGTSRRYTSIDFRYIHGFVVHPPIPPIVLADGIWDGIWLTSTVT